jgi:hypothetical protein
MKKHHLLLLVLAVLTGLYLLISSKQVQPDQVRQASTAEVRLGEANLKCKVRADAAVADKVPIIEFQKLEIESHREWVFFHCMQDQGYSENPAWQTAAGSRTHDSEALKALRRAQMQLTLPQDGLPAFWLAPRA